MCSRPVGRIPLITLFFAPVPKPPPSQPLHLPAILGQPAATPLVPTLSFRTHALSVGQESAFPFSPVPPLPGLPSPVTGHQPPVTSFSPLDCSIIIDYNIS